MMDRPRAEALLKALMLDLAALGRGGGYKRLNPTPARREAYRDAIEWVLHEVRSADYLVGEVRSAENRLRYALKTWEER